MHRAWTMLSLVVFVLLSSPPLFAQSQRIVIGQEQVSTYADDVKSALNIPSLAVGVVGPSETHYLDVRGEGDTDQPFIIGSLSKAVTATAVMLLVHDGELALDDPASGWVDGVPEQVTVEHLLHHKSGLDRAAGVDAWTRDANVEQAARRASWGEPGAEFAYSNLNYEILGAIIERVSEQPYGDFLAERIFEPAGMHNASAAPEPPTNHVLGHQYMFGFPVQFGEPDYNAAAVPSGFIWMSAEDMEKWTRLFLNEGRLDGEQVIPAEVVSALLEAPEESDYAMGWVGGSESGSEAYSHTGLTGAFSASATIVPRRNLAVFAMANVNSWTGSAPENLVESIVGAALRGEAEGHSNLEFLVRLGFGLLCLFVLLLFLKELVQWITGNRPTALDKQAQRGVIVDVVVASALIIGMVVLFGTSPLELLVATPDLGIGFLMLVLLLPLRRLLHGFNETEERTVLGEV